MSARRRRRSVKDAPGFHELFDADPEAAASAPGRVNLIGEHTDYSGGYVLPTPIPQRAGVELRRRDDGRVRAASRDVGDATVEEYRAGEERAGRGWLDYVQGVTAVLGRDGLLPAAAGFDLRIASDVPPGGGVSSSAALEVALLRGLRELWDLAIDDVAVARLGQRVETDFVGAPIGIMDQMAASVGEPGAALFLDTRSLAFERVPIPETIELLVIDSAVKHSHAGGEYRERREEVEAAARALGVGVLRELEARPQEAADAAIASLAEPLRRRARHVATENRRVLEAVAALRAGDGERLGAILSAGHASLRDDFEVSVPEIDRLVALAEAEPGCLGARLTGGGFGGCIVAVCRSGTAAGIGERVVAAYRRETGKKGVLLVPEATDRSQARAR